MEPAKSERPWNQGGLQNPNPRSIVPSWGERTAFAPAIRARAGVPAGRRLSLRWRNARLGLLGALLVTGLSGLLVGDRISGAALPMQCGFVFLILHSLAWRDEDDRAARSVRLVACGFWMLDSLFLLVAPLPHAQIVLYCGATVVIGVSLIARWLLGAWRKPAVAITALTVLSLPLVADAAAQLQARGVLAATGSFLLFALATFAALTRSHWHRHAAPHTAVRHQPGV